MKVRPMPKKLLQDSIVINDVEYLGVRVEPSDRRSTVTPYGDQVESNYLVFIDRVNTPKFEELKNLLKIGFAGVWYDENIRTVTHVDVIKEFKDIHHLEVYLR